MPTRLRLLAFASILTAAAPALAQSAFNGKWKVDLASQSVDAKPNSYALKDGTYSCRSCTPAYTVKADGTPQAVAGQDYWDKIAVTVVDDRNVRYAFWKDGKQVAEGVATVSADGGVLSRVSRNTNNGGGVPVETKGMTTRVGAPVAGAHLISGEWKAAPATSASDVGLTMDIAVNGDAIRVGYGIGETLEATIGGDYALNQGDPGKTMTKVERVGPDALKMTDRRGGKVVNIATYRVDADGVLRGEWVDPQTGDKGTVLARKQ